jgi:Secretion system C-terminal sorting domain
MIRKFLFASLVIVLSFINSVAQTLDDGLFVLLGYSNQTLAYVNAETDAITDLGSVAPTATKLRLFDETLFVVNGDDFASSEGGGIWFATVDEIESSIDEERDISWTIKALDGVNPYDCLKHDNRLFVSLQTGNAVVALDFEDNLNEINRFDGISNPQGLAASSEYIAIAESGLGSGTDIHLIDISTMEIFDTIEVGLNPQFIAVDSQDNFHVVCTGNYSDISGQAVKVSISEMLFSIETVGLGGSPRSIQCVTDSDGNDIVYVGDEYAFSSPHLYGYEPLEMMQTSDNFSSVSGGWTLAGFEGELFVGSSTLNTITSFKDGEFSPISEFFTGVSDLVYWHFEESKIEEFSPVVSLPISVDLSPAWPNPFNATTSLSLNIDNSINANISLYNMLGQKISTIKSGLISAGNHRFVIDSNDLTSGTYLVVLQSSDVQKARKITLVR